MSCKLPNAGRGSNQNGNMVSRISRYRQARKRGTPGEGRNMVAHRGERLIGHLQAKVDGGKVGE